MAQGRGWGVGAAAGQNPPGHKIQTKDRITRLVGYGQVNDAALYRSLDDAVTLLAEEQIANNQHHIFFFRQCINKLNGIIGEPIVFISMAHHIEQADHNFRIRL